MMSIARFDEKIAEMVKARAQMTDHKRHYVCPACFKVVRVEKPSRSNLTCWCDYDSPDIGC